MAWTYSFDSPIARCANRAMPGSSEDRVVDSILFQVMNEIVRDSRKVATIPPIRPMHREFGIHMKLKFA
ncbi:hypothetical protein XH91_12745 [Bradyrhizobium guangzhouense]|uniref:Uncharacterized protein n=1 Tax=Bradyrhizobium guangzhouense TaxID=1325095 RepID=A0AAE5X030_9BRAD|nr:hypothetical protein XH91_12745 [Bradyrhizobium guangzhouense]